MNERNKHYLKILALAFIFALIASYKCTPDNYCDPDPIYGGCPDTCDFQGNLWIIVGRTIGMYFILSIGSVMGEEYNKRKMVKETNSKAI